MTENTQKAEAPRPIQDWENRRVKGEALFYKEGYNNHLERVSKLRERQEAYEASLPTDPIEAMSQINSRLSDIGDISGPEYAVRAALEIIHQLTTDRTLDDSDELKDAIFWLTRQGLNGLASIEESTQHVRAIARQFHPLNQPFRA